MAPRRGLPICKVSSLWFAVILFWLSGSWSGSSSVLLRGRAVNVSASIVDSRSPSLALSDRVIHIVWEERNRVYHRSWDGSTWSSPASIAVGEQPALATDALGRAHVVFVNEFGGNYEIYHCRWSGTSWSLPRNVSNTSGVSSSPSLSIAADGTIHVVWADNTPGYSVIYHAYWNGTYWINEPMPHALGGAPAAVVDSGGAVHVVWQDRDGPGVPYEVYYSRLSGDTWSLPEDLSDTSAEQSIIPSVAIDTDGQAHVAWQERVDTRYTVHYTRGTVGYWSIPEQVSEGEADAYLPSLSVSAASTVYVGWDESTWATYRQRGLGEVDWSECTSVSDDPRGVTELQLAIDHAGQLHAVWTRLLGGNWDVFYQNLAYRLALPQVLKTYPR